LGVDAGLELAPCRPICIGPKHRFDKNDTNALNTPPALERREATVQPPEAAPAANAWGTQRVTLARGSAMLKGRAMASDIDGRIVTEALTNYEYPIVKP
jgi:hypothetical protein